MQIINCTVEDIPAMQQLYDQAREFQKEKSNWHWLSFENSMLKNEIEEKRQWKIIEEEKIACIFMTLYDDPYIWGEKNKDPSIYIHRIVTHPDFRGNNYTLTIIDWAKEQAKVLGKRFIRMDTWGENVKLRDYYVKCGFTYLETITPQSTENLPSHYTCISLSLLEIKLDS
jgi:GNAT superfamily N-acetyltransferase